MTNVYLSVHILGIILSSTLKYMFHGKLNWGSLKLIQYEAGSCQKCYAFFPSGYNT